MIAPKPDPILPQILEFLGVVAENGLGLLLWGIGIFLYVLALACFFGAIGFLVM